MDADRTTRNCGSSAPKTRLGTARGVGLVAMTFLLTALCSTGALAQVAGPQTRADPRQVDYLNGGFGTEQADLLREMSSQFPVRFTFSQHNAAENTDEFVADIRLRITDIDGHTVLDLSDQGPIFLLRLPTGTYTVEAEHEGEVKTRRFQVVRDRHQEIGFSWRG